MIFRFASLVLFLASAVFAQDAIHAGTYKGQWSGATANGDFNLIVDSAGKIASVTFTIGGENVPTKIISSKIDGAKVEVVYDFDLQGNALRSAITGSLKGKAIEGTYKTTAGDQSVDSGTWTAAVQ